MRTLIGWYRAGVNVDAQMPLLSAFLGTSFVALMITAGVQVVVVVITGSVALFADTIHDFSDALTAIPLFIALRLGRGRANQRYTSATGGPKTLPDCSYWR